MYLSTVKQLFEAFVDSITGFRVERTRCGFIPPDELHFRRFRVDPDVRAAASNHKADASLVATRSNAVLDVQHTFEVVENSALLAVIKAFELCLAARASVIYLCIKISFTDIFAAFGAAVHLAVVDSFKGFGDLDAVLSVFVIHF